MPRNSTEGKGVLMKAKILACLLAVAALGAPAFSQESAEDWYQEGETYYDQKRYHAAIALKSDSVNMYCNRGCVQMKLGDFEGAISDFSTGIRLDAGYRKGAQYYWRATSRSMTKASTETIEDFTRALEFGYENRYEVHIQRGLAHHALEKNREAHRDFTIAAEIDARKPEAFVRRGELSYVLKRLGPAERDLARALEIDPTESTACLYMGLIDLIMGRYDEAAERFTTAMSTEQDRIIALHNLATVCLLTNRAGKADDLLRESWQEYDRQATNYVYAVVSRYFCLLKLGEEAEGRGLLDEAYREAAPPGWAYPLLRYLNEDWTAEELFASFVDDQVGLTMSQAVIGLEKLYAGRPAEAMPHLRWVAHQGSAAPFSTQALLEYRNQVAENAELTDAIPAAVYFEPDPAPAGRWGRLVAEYIPFPGDVVVEETWTIRSPGLTSPPLKKSHVINLGDHRQLIDFRIPEDIEAGFYELRLDVAFEGELRRISGEFEVKPPMGSPRSR